ncbi:MAG: helix-turn-helix domain-containing protein [Planctomycetes bacterium]|nr:helix-turn-helix domain-containing protein [Planctomycetota bacterium]
MKTEIHANSTLKRVTVKGKRMVIELWEPEMPARDAKGNYPALEALAVLQARDILRTRRKLGLSQKELARRAGVRVETLNRIEHATSSPNVPTMVKINRALKEAALQAETR